MIVTNVRLVCVYARARACMRACVCGCVDDETRGEEQQDDRHERAAVVHVYVCVFVCACVRVYLTESMLTNSIFTVPGSSARPEAAQGEDPDLV